VLVVALLAAAVVVVLAVHYAGTAGPGRVDRHVDEWLQAHLGAHARLAHDVANLANVPVAGALIAALATACLLRGWRRGAVLAVVGPTLAGAITQYLLKPLVDRTIGAGLAFPSGHTTGAVAIALVVVILALRARLHRAARIALVVAAVVYAVGIPVALVVGRFHYATDTVGGACVASATVLTVALVVDAVSSRSAAERGRGPWPLRRRGRVSGRQSPTEPVARSWPR
jgi:undecaprenyl-diphosphatase